MRFFGPKSLTIAMLLAAGTAAAQSRDSDWVSYRDAYKAMVVFEKYGKPKQFLQHTYQVTPKDKAAPLEGLRLALNGKSMQLNLPLDATGRAVFPLLKAAYDENAALVLNRDIHQYAFKPRVSIVTRPDGVYEAAELRTACEQALAFLRYENAANAGKRCSGVRFVYTKSHAEPVVKLRVSDRETVLPAADGPAFPDDSAGSFRVVNYRFSDWPASGSVVTQDAPVALAPVIE
ncbi:MAG TPA: hypothetical protein VFF16_15705 [Telluria sp.]|nr:hypothetical protein [Telluria sp.]